MADCVNDIIDGLDPSCEALKKQGGLNKRVWIGNFDDIATTTDGDGYIDAVALSGSPTPTLFKFIGRQDKNNSTITGVIGENLNILQQALNLILYYFTPAERASIEGLVNADQLIVFVETKGGEGKATIEIFGITNGLKTSAVTGGSGVLLNDSTALTVTLTGDEIALPKVLKSGTFNPNEVGYLQENIDYLDNLSA